MQGVDAALIPTISFPAFATHEDVLCVETKANIVRRLKGRYGFKRFARDGYKSLLEDPNRKYYRNGETKVIIFQYSLKIIIHAQLTVDLD